MKKILILLSAAVLAAALCACSGGEKSAPEESEKAVSAANQNLQLNSAPKADDNAAAAELAKELSGTWANEEDYTERYVFGDDLSFIRYLGGKTYSGSLSLGDGDVLDMTFNDADIAPASYSKVESAEEADGSSWYLGDGHLVLGGRKLVKTIDY